MATGVAPGQELPWGHWGHWGQVLLCAVSLGCAHRARQVTGGPATGFLLQALAAASDALTPLWPDVPNAVPNTADPVPATWLSSVLSPPLVTFGLHRLSGDRATANVLLVAALAAVAAVAVAGPGAEGRALAGRGVTAVTCGSLLALAALTGNGPGAVAAALVAATEAVAPQGVPWVRVAASLALLRALQRQRVALGTAE